MKIELNHRFVVKCDYLQEMLTGVFTMQQFCSRLEEYAKEEPDVYPIPKFWGDGFELFVEAFIKLNYGNKILRIGEYKTGDELEAATGTPDMGVDGWGTGFNGKNAAVQAKYVTAGNRRKMLVANEVHDDKRLTNFTSQAWGNPDSNLQVDQNDTKNLILISTAKGLHPTTKEKMFHNKVHFVGWDTITKLVDNNHYFWNAFREMCEEQQ